MTKKRKPKETRREHREVEQAFEKIKQNEQSRQEDYRKKEKEKKK